MCSAPSIAQNMAQGKYNKVIFSVVNLNNFFVFTSYQMFQIEVFIKCRSHLHLLLSYPTSQDLFGLWLIVNTVIIFFSILGPPFVGSWAIALQKSNKYESDASDDDWNADNVLCSVAPLVWPRINDS